MAGAAVPYICGFSDDQKKIFENLENEFKEKWNISLRWDSKVPERDKCFFYFCTLKSLNRDQICKELKEFEGKFGEIHEEMKKIRSGDKLSQQYIQDMRKKFEKVLQNVKEMNESTDSSSFYRATSDILKRSENVLRCFDNAEIVQSRKELLDKKVEMDEFKREYENQTRKVRTLSKSLEEYKEKEREHLNTIDELQNQLKASHNNYLQSSNVINELMQKVNQIPLDVQNLMETNASVKDKLNILAKSVECSIARERKRDDKLQNLEDQLAVSSEQILEEIQKLMQLMKKILCLKGNFEKKQNIVEVNSSWMDEFGASSEIHEASAVLEQTRDDRIKSLEDQLRVSTERNREMREECETLMQLINQVLSAQNDSSSKGNARGVDTLLRVIMHITCKLNKLMSSLEESPARERKRDEKIENVEKQIKVNSKQILRKIHKLMQLMNERL